MIIILNHFTITGKWQLQKVNFMIAKVNYPLRHNNETSINWSEKEYAVLFSSKRKKLSGNNRIILSPIQK